MQISIQKEIRTDYNIIGFDNRFCYKSIILTSFRNVYIFLLAFYVFISNNNVRYLIQIQALLKKNYALFYF